MPKVEILNLAKYDETTGIYTITAADETNSLAGLNLRIEGDYVAISASYGPLEIALRPRGEELKHVLKMLQPVDGLQISRQLGSGGVSIGLGLHSDGKLLIRPAIVGDASGYIAINLVLASDVRAALFNWFGI
ncbi:MAG: hypothetical protein IT320_18205 [Anaerolineae bacterium]|nr:hypothetical protein [Anaerolineae bacterium]